MGSNPTRASNVFKHLVGFGLSLVCTLIAQRFQEFHRFQSAFWHVFDVVPFGCAIVIAQGDTGNYAASTDPAGKAFPGEKLVVTFDRTRGFLDGRTDNLAVLASHEGSHVADDMFLAGVKTKTIQRLLLVVWMRGRCV